MRKELIGLSRMNSDNLERIKAGNKEALIHRFLVVLLFAVLVGGVASEVINHFQYEIAEIACNYDLMKPQVCEFMEFARKYDGNPDYMIISVPCMNGSSLCWGAIETKDAVCLEPHMFWLCNDKSLELFNWTKRN